MPDSRRARGGRRPADRPAGKRPAFREIILAVLGFVREHSRAVLASFVAVGVLLAVWAVSAVIGSATALNAARVIVSGAEYAVVDQPSLTADDLKAQLSAAIMSGGGADVRLTDEIKVEPVRAAKSDMITFDLLLQRLRADVKYQFAAVSLRVAGIQYAVLRSRGECDDILSRVKSEYWTDSTDSAEFVEEVTFDTVYVTADELSDSEAVFAELIATVDTPVDYYIEAGDTLDAIAIKYGMEKSRLIELNPGIEERERTLQIGERVTATEPKPKLSVRTKTARTYTTVAPKKTVERTAADWPSSYRKVVVEGRDGQKEVTEYIIRINGFEQPEREFVSEKITSEPVDEVIEVGVQ
ncbi:MAG: G5 domain-containing protein [Clostridiales bacterium]|jgi:LysM repeat protein|nr:G5 domain-containing protein [Clostridiales bacterium]